MQEFATTLRLALWTRLRTFSYAGIAQTKVLLADIPRLAMPGGRFSAVVCDVNILMKLFDSGRRRFITIAGQAGIASFCACMLGRNSAAATELPAEPRGCVLNATEASYIENFLMMKSSGLSRVDHAIASEIPAIKDAFRIDAEFSYINDRYGINAFAIPRSTPPKAMVVLGIRLMHLVIGSSAPIEAGQIPPRFPSATAGTVAAILAHE